MPALLRAALRPSVASRAVSAAVSPAPRCGHLRSSLASSFSSCAARRESFPSKLHPGLYYHRTAADQPLLVSYLPQPPPSLTFSPTTIGSLRALKTTQQDGPPADSGMPPISPRTFTPNPDFVRLVHEVIALNIAEDAWMQTQAKAATADTHIHISDLRQPADANRVPDPQDILGSVLVQNQQLVPDSYEPNDVAYRLVTEAGLIHLPGELHTRLKEACERVFELEKEAAREEAEMQQQ